MRDGGLLAMGAVAGGGVGAAAGTKRSWRAVTWPPGPITSTRAAWAPEGSANASTATSGAAAPRTMRRWTDVTRL